MNNFDLAYIKEAVRKGEKKVEVLFLQTDSNSPDVQYVKKELPAEVVLKNLSLPFAKRTTAWKKIVPINYKAGPSVKEDRVVIDQNSLSDPKLIELLAANPDFMKALRAQEKAAKKEAKEDKPYEEGKEVVATITDDNND